MARGGRKKDREEPERRCIATGDSGSTDLLIRFVLGPDGSVVPDLAEKLPGRGAWVAASRSALEKVQKKGLFSRAFKTQALVSPDLVSQIDDLLMRRVVQGLALCRKAGRAVAGFEKVRDALLRAEWDGPEDLERAQGVFLIQASDGADDGRRKLSRMVPEDLTFTVLSGSELGLAFGRPCVIHAALLESGATKRAIRDIRRLAGVRDLESDGVAQGSALSETVVAEGSGSSGPYSKHDA